MQDTAGAGNGVDVGSTRVFKRLNPREIAVKSFRLNEQTIQVMHATDQEFELFVQASGVKILDPKGTGMLWTFDDRCRFINHCGRCGISLPLTD